MLRIKDSKRLPGGIHFELLPAIDATSTSATSSDDDQPEEAKSRTSHVLLSSHPLSIRQIFEQYSLLGSRIRKHYLSPKVLFRLLTGRFVPPLGREEMYGLQYSVLPRERVGLAEVWRILNDDSDEATAGWEGG